VNNNTLNGQTQQNPFSIQTHTSIESLNDQKYQLKIVDANNSITNA